LRKIENINQKDRNTSYSLFNDTSDNESKDLSTLKLPMPDQNQNQNILKLAEDTLNFIDQELTKSYKVTSIGQAQNSPSPNKDEERKLQLNDALKSIGN
jgi:beta-galactosidase/beta-glucuronidase